MIEQVKETRHQADAAIETARTAASEFALSHRPKLIIRNVVLPIGNTLELADGSFAVANIGDLPAEITNAHCEILIAKDLPMRRPYEENHIGNIPTAAHVVNPFNVYAVGYVRYVDKRHQNPRRTVFARIYDYRLKRFIPVEQSDYEYSD
jgi:hypothetical protein